MSSEAGQAAARLEVERQRAGAEMHVEVEQRAATVLVLAGDTPPHGDRQSRAVHTAVGHAPVHDAAFVTDPLIEEATDDHALQRAVHDDARQVVLVRVRLVVVDLVVVGDRGDLVPRVLREQPGDPSAAAPETDHADFHLGVGFRAAYGARLDDRDRGRRPEIDRSG